MGLTATVVLPTVEPLIIIGRPRGHVTPSSLPENCVIPIGMADFLIEAILFL